MCLLAWDGQTEKLANLRVVITTCLHRLLELPKLKPEHNIELGKHAAECDTAVHWAFRSECMERPLKALFGISWQLVKVTSTYIVLSQKAHLPLSCPVLYT